MTPEEYDYPELTDPETKSAEELAKETQNPVANLISIHFHNNCNLSF